MTLALDSSGMSDKTCLRNPGPARPAPPLPRSLPLLPFPSLAPLPGRKVYLSLAEWKNKKELKETAEFTSSGQLPPDIAQEVTSRSDSDEEGNRLQRRMAKKDKRKSGKI